MMMLLVQMMTADLKFTWKHCIMRATIVHQLPNRLFVTEVAIKFSESFIEVLWKKKSLTVLWRN